MKATGMIELVIIVAALIMGLPLFLLCNKMANTDINTIYMNDKSTWDIAADLEYEMQGGVLVPKNLIEPLTISPAQAAVLTYVQDEYTPNSARLIDFNYDATTLDDTTIDTANPLDASRNVEPCWYDLTELSFKSEPNSRVAWDTGHKVYKQVSPALKIDDLYGQKLYFVYNYERDSWMCTTRYINIFYGM